MSIVLFEHMNVSHIVVLNVLNNGSHCVF